MAAKVLEDEIKEDKNVSNLLDGMKSMNLNNDDHKHYQNIPLWLKDFESPFHWHTYFPRARSSEFMIERCLEKLIELYTDEHDFVLRRYSILLKLLLEYSVLKYKDKVVETMETIKKSIEQFSVAGDLQYETVKTVLDHVISTTEAYLLILDGQEDQSKKIAQVIVPINQMSNSNKAGLHVIKAEFFFFSGYDVSENFRVELARKALALEPENPEWLFLLSRLLRQQRKEIPFNPDVPREELVVLEQAVQLCKSAKYIISLAQAYRESAAQAHKQYRSEPNYYSSDLHKAIENMQRKSLTNYREALNLEPDSASNLRKIGYGIMNLPVRLADYDLAIECLTKSLKLSYNMVTVHIIGTFYHRYRNDNKKALQYFEETANAGLHAGLSDMIRVKYILNPDYDPCEDIEKGFKSETIRKNRVFLLTQKSGYFLFIKRNFIKSIDSFNQAISEDKESLHLTVFKSLFIRMADTMNLYHIMANEALLYLNQNNSSSEDKDDNIYEVMALIDTINSIHPGLGEIDPDPNLIDELCKQKNMIRNKNRSYQNYEKSNFQRGRHGGFQQREKGSPSGRGEGASENYNNRRGRPFHGDQRNAEEEPSRSFSSNSSGRGQYPKRGTQRGSRSDEDSNWRRK